MIQVMDKKKLLEKIEREEQLSLVEQAHVEELLANDPIHGRIRETLQALPQDAPSLEWRSRLNERLGREKRQPAKRFAWSRLGWALSAAACTIVIATVLVLQRIPGAEEPQPVISASQLMEWHEEATGAAALPEDGARMSTFAIADEGAQTANEVEDLLYGTSLESL